MLELDDGEQAYLAAFHELHTPSEAATEASLARVQERLAAGHGVAVSDDSDDDAEPKADRSRLRPLVVLSMTAIAIAAAVVLMMRLDLTTMLASEVPGDAPAGAVYAGQDSGDVEGEAVARAPSRRAVGPVAADPVVVPEPEVEPEPMLEQPPAQPAVEAPTQRRRPRPVEAPPVEAPPAEAPPADATLHAEIALLRPASKALRSGDHARALRLFEDHARSFPRSVLAEERSLGRIQALCGLGRQPEARRMIDAFGRAHPGSPLTGRVKKACPAEEAP